MLGGPPGEPLPKNESDLDRFYSSEDPWRTRSLPEKRVRYQELLRLLRGWKGKKALDISCGEGDFASDLARFSESVDGCDLSKVVLARAKERFPKLNFFQLDIRALDEKVLAPYDIITWVDAIYWLRKDDLPKPLAALSKRPARLVITSRINPPSAPVPYWNEHDFTSTIEFMGRMQIYFPDARFVPLQLHFGISPDAVLTFKQKAARLILRVLSRVLGYRACLRLTQHIFLNRAFARLVEPFVVHIAMVRG